LSSSPSLNVSDRGEFVVVEECVCNLQQAVFLVLLEIRYLFPNMFFRDVVEYIVTFFEYI